MTKLSTEIQVSHCVWYNPETRFDQEGFGLQLLMQVSDLLVNFMHMQHQAGMGTATAGLEIPNRVSSLDCFKRLHQELSVMEVSMMVTW